MNHVSIFEKKWLDLVFEGKNKTYGAYQLRRENTRTTLLALFFALLLLASAVSVPLLIGRLFSSSVVPKVIEDTVTLVQLTDLDQPKPQGPKTETIVPIERQNPDKQTPAQLDNPEIVKPQDANQNIATNNENHPVDIPATTGTPGLNPMNGNPGGSDTPTETHATTGEDTGTTILLPKMLDKLPAFPGGIDKFYRYIRDKFKEPESNEEKTIKVYVSFVIEKDGTMSDIKVIRDPGYGLGTEALRVLKSLKTKWEPGLYKSQPVRTAYTLPITVNMK